MFSHQQSVKYKIAYDGVSTTRVLITTIFGMDVICSLDRPTFLSPFAVGQDRMWRISIFNLWFTLCSVLWRFVLWLAWGTNSAILRHQWPASPVNAWFWASTRPVAQNYTSKGYRLFTSIVLNAMMITKNVYSRSLSLISTWAFQVSACGN